jgi:hypothetical protein
MERPVKMAVAVCWTLLAFCVCGSLAQEPGLAKPQAAGETRDIEKDLRDEIHRLEKEHLPALFSGLCQPNSAVDLGLSSEQRTSIERLDTIARAVVRGWLLREMGDARTKRMAEHLSDRSIRLKGRITAHAEALALQGILTARQADQVRSKNVPAAGSDSKLPSDRTEQKRQRSSDRSTGLAFSRDEVARLKSTLEGEARALYINNDHVSDYFSVFTDSHHAEELRLSPEQSRLIGELDRLTRSIIRDWLLRGIGDPTPPPDLADRVSERGMGLRNEIVAHAEAIARLGILTQNQAEQSTRFLWRQLGYRALLDPELAARIHLTRQQRQEIAVRIKDKKRITQEADETLGGFRALASKDRELARQADREIRRRVTEAEARIWEILDPGQVEIMEEIIMTPVSPVRRRR